MGLLDGLFAKGELTLGELETKKYEKKKTSNITL